MTDRDIRPGGFIYSYPVGTTPNQSGNIVGLDRSKLLAMAYDVAPMFGFRDILLRQQAQTVVGLEVANSRLLRDMAVILIQNRFDVGTLVNSVDVEFLKDGGEVTLSLDAPGALLGATVDTKLVMDTGGDPLNAIDYLHRCILLCMHYRACSMGDYEG